ncbi:MAG: DUF222 domain-containing protein [Frankiaceae bacterium]|nr:DUF222 domain-containing protein [Frankiaceae bacterium]
MDALAAVRVESLPIGDLQAFVARGAQAMNRLAGLTSRAVGEIQVRGGGLVPDTGGASAPTPAWLRSVTKETGAAAGRRVRTSVALRELPLVRDAIVDGDVTEEHGRVLARLVGKIAPGALLESQESLLEVARRCDPDQLANFVRHLLATWCEPDLEAEEASAEERRFLQLRNTHKGSWRGTFELPDAAMEVVLTVLEALARREGKDDKRTSGVRRADALLDVFGLALRHGELPDTGGARPRVSYVVPATWALRLPSAAERAVGDDPTAGFVVDVDQHPGADCATAPWTGPATRAQLERLLCDAQVERVVLDAAGQVVSLTSVTDVITAAQRRAVAARDRCCTAKGCSKPPAFCDVHHLRSREDGGPTELGNLVLLCRRHHVMWHRGLIDLVDLRTPWLRLPRPRAPALD